MSLVILGAASWWLWTSSSWQALWPAQAAAARMSAIPEVNTPLPVPTAAEAYLRRGRDLFDSGRLRDALAEYDRVPAGDPLRVSADEMRAHIQRELLSLALAETSSSFAARERIASFECAINRCRRTASMSLGAIVFASSASNNLSVQAVQLSSASSTCALSVGVKVRQPLSSAAAESA